MIPGDNEHIAVIISGDRAETYFCNGRYLSCDCADGIGDRSVLRQDSLCAQHLCDTRQTDVGWSSCTDKLCPCLKNAGKEAVFPAAAGTGKLPGIMDQVIHLGIERLFGKRCTFRCQENADQIFVQPLCDEIIGLLRQILHTLRFAAAHKKGGSMEGSFCGKGSIVAADMHEISGSKTAAQDDPCGLQAAEVGGIDIFFHDPAGGFIREGTVFQGAAQRFLAAIEMPCFIPFYIL